MRNGLNTKRPNSPKRIDAHGELGRLDVGPRPAEQRPEHAATVERERRNHVEPGENDVQQSEISEHEPEGITRERIEADKKHRAKSDADDRTADRDPELVAPSARLVFGAGHAAEQPQRDRLDPVAVVPGDGGMAEFVQQNTDEQPDSRRRADQPRRHSGGQRVEIEPGIEPLIERRGCLPHSAADEVHQERQNQQERHVDFDRNPGDRTDTERLEHMWNVYQDGKEGFPHARRPLLSIPVTRRKDDRRRPRRQ